jgi:hypothetical protein
MPLRSIEEESDTAYYYVAIGDRIDYGDLLYLDTANNVVRRASQQADQGTEVANQALFNDLFVGIAVGETTGAETTQTRIPVRRYGVATYDCAPATFQVDDWIGPVEQGNGTQLENQRVMRVTNAANAIGRCEDRTAANATMVRFRVRPSRISLVNG